MPDKQEPAKKAVTKKAAKKTSSTAAKKAPAKKAAAKPAAGFSLDDALAVAKTRKSEDTTKAAKIAAKEKAIRDLEAAEQKTEKRKLGAASLADILGGATAPKKINHRDRKVAKKYEAFHKLLMELHDHVAHGLHQHAEDTLKRSSKEESGDLSGYSQHMADAGTESFDRDFALSMVSSEQDALHEIEEALERIYNGTYGICQTTGKQIRDVRLMAVPFTRYSIKTQSELEKYKPKGDRGGVVFADASAEDGIGFGNEDADDE